MRYAREIQKGRRRPCENRGRNLNDAALARYLKLEEARKRLSLEPGKGVLPMDNLISDFWDPE